jgi:hypothetical protein
MYDRLTDYKPVGYQPPRFHFVIRIAGMDDIGPFKSAMLALSTARKTYSNHRYQIVQINEG